MSVLPLTVRYFVDSTPLGTPCREESFERRELVFELPVARTALVLVDLWNKHHIASWMERAARIEREIIVPIIDRAREVGLTVVFSPSPEVLAQSPRKLEVYQGKGPATVPVVPAPTWPPMDFLHRSGEYSTFRHPRNQDPSISLHRPDQPVFDMAPCITVKPGDYVVASGHQLHDLCEERGILHLLYAGFATNWCILKRDYAIAAMSARGYNCILLREATDGVEFPDTLEKHWATEIAIREVEQQYGYTVSNASFYEACRRATS